METKVNDVLVSKEVLNLFKNSTRIIDKLHIRGIRMIDAQLLKKLNEKLPEVCTESIMKKYNLAIGYQGKTVKEDFAKMGIANIDDRILSDIWIHGIPVPWQLLNKAGIDYKKFNMYYTSK